MGKGVENDLDNSDIIYGCFLKLHNFVKDSHFFSESMGGFSSKKLAELEVPKSGAYTKKVIDWYV